MAEEVRHRTMLFDLYRTKFGEYLPLIRHQDVKGFIQKKPLWLMHPLNLDEVLAALKNCLCTGCRTRMSA
jgi:erythrin-vacuolar iron transport family protein